MTYYPVTIPTLNRYEHLRRCVESLARNTHADKTELVIGLDFPPSPKYEEGYRRIKAYLPTITGFRKVTVIEHDHNVGAYSNGSKLKEYVYKHYDAVIYSEDDNEFAPCFLDFMNKMLAYYKDDRRVASVSGYLHPEFHGISTTGLLFTKESNGWGIGTWRDELPDEDERYHIVYGMLGNWRLSWKSFTTYPAVFRMLVKMVSTKRRWGDTSRTQINILQGSYQVRPAVSLCRNWGNDGSGVNCSVVNALAEQPISEATTFDEPTSWEPYYPESVARATFRLTWPKNNLKFVGKLIITAVLYLKYRLKSMMS